MLLAETEVIEPRYAVYLEELREFLANRDVAFGEPLDLVPFAARLGQTDSFRAEMSSMVRAVIFREQETISHADLLALVCTAVGGTQVNLSDPALDKAGREILQFLGQAFRSLWGRAPQEAPKDAPADHTEEDSAPAQSAAAPAAELHPSPAPPRASLSGAIAAGTVLEELEPAPAPATAAPPPPEITLQPEAAPAMARLSALRARSLEPSLPTRPVNPAPRFIEEVRVAPDISWTPLVVPDRDDDAAGSRAGNALRRVRSLWRDATPAEDGEGKYPEYTRLPLFTRERRPLWLVGVCGIGLGLALGWGLRKDAPAPPPAAQDQPAKGFHPWFPPIPQPAGESPAAAPVRPAPLPKPSPYGDTVQNARPANRPQGSDTPRSGAAPVNAMRRRVEAALAGRDEELAETLPRPRESIFLSVAGPMAGNLLAAPAPVYPPSAIEAGIHGKVTVQSVVGADGKVISSRVLSGAAPLRDAALNAVRYWRYRPYRVEGVPTSVVTNATLDFQLAH